MGNYLHKTHNKDNNNDEDNEVCPPEALAMVHASAALGRLTDDGVAVVNLTLGVGHVGG